MKTAETILREEISKGYSKPITDEQWEELQEDLGYQAVLSAMKLYAEQAIDEASKVADADVTFLGYLEEMQLNEAFVPGEDFEVYVINSSILDVKKLLK